MQANASMRPSVRFALLLPFILIAGCGTGDGPTPIPGTPAPPPPPVVCEGINFEVGCGPYNFTEFEGGLATVVNNPDPGGLNTTDKVARMQKFAATSGATFGGSTLEPPETIDLGQGAAFTMRVQASRSVPVLFKLEGPDTGSSADDKERTKTYGGSGEWELLCFDFNGDLPGTPISGITFIFDNGTNGNAAADPVNWTFYFDEIKQIAACPAPPPFETITFDDPDTTYTLTDFGGLASVVTNDPAGGTNKVAQSVKGTAALDYAGVTVSTLSNDEVPRIPLTAASNKMSVRMYSPDAGIPVRLKIEDAANSAVSAETQVTTTEVNTWETLVFDFANPVPGTPAFNEANNYNRISLFFNFGTTGAAAGAKTYFFDDVAVGAGPGGGGITPEHVVYATDPGVTEDLAPPAIDNFGSGAVFDGAFAGDPDYNPAFQVTSGQNYGAGVDVGFVAFNGYAAGFAAGYGTFEFKVKVNAPGSATNFEVKFINGGDTPKYYDLTTYAGSTPLGNGWYQVQIPMSDFAANIAANSGFLLGPAGEQAGPFTMLLTDIGFSGTAGGGTSCAPVGNEFAAANGDFELGNLDCWSTFDNGGTISVVADNGPSAPGSSAGRLNVTVPGNPTLKLANLGAGTVAPGQQITVSFDWKGTDANGGVVDVVLFSELSGGGVSKTDPILGGAGFPANWTTVGPLNLTAGADVSGGVTLQITAICGGVAGCVSEVFIDNVSIIIAP